MLVRRLMIKFYLLLVVSVAVLGVGIDYFLQQEHSHNENPGNHLGSMLYVESLLTSNPKESWPRLIADAENRISLAIEGLEFDDIDVDQVTSTLLQEEQLVHLELDHKDILLKKLSGADYIIRIEIPLQQEESFTWVAAFYLLLAIPIIFWFWPLALDLNQLEKATKAIGENKFDYRIRLNSNSAINSISRTFNEMADRITYLIEEQKALTNAVSHEIRTPLARLKFALELQKKKQPNVQALQQVDAMQQDVEELSDLADEMLSYAKLDKIDFSIELQKIPAEPWLSTVVDECRKSNADIEIVTRCDVRTITVDPHLMARALSNLILNAFRYARKKITIQLKGRKNGFRLIVSDDGDGIPENQRQRLFEPFAKMDQSRNEKKQGHGLGLAIVKRIVDKHEGQIWVTDAESGGAQFVLKF